MSEIETFASREALADAAASLIASHLRDGIAARDRAVFVGTGGSTPGPIYDRLRETAGVDWPSVTVTLTDERITRSEDAQNELLLRERLLGDVHGATYLPLNGEDALDALPLPADITLLGMGGDGHIASIFPAGENMELAREARTARLVRTVPSPLPDGAPYPRWTMSLPMLRQTRSLLIAITGDSKREVIEQQIDGTAPRLPVRDILETPDLPVRIFWAP